MGSINFTTGIRELKFGESFTNPNSKKTFHTLKYDFKPACVDEKKPALLEIGPDKQVTVTVPNLDGSEEPNTVFKGSQRDYSKKDCVLVINKLTGEITLERLSTKIQVKTTSNESKVTKSPPQQITAANISARQPKSKPKTKITTGSRKKTPIGLVSKRSPPQNTPSSSIVGQGPTMAVTSTDSINNLPKEATNNNSNPNNNHHHPYSNHQPEANVEANLPSGVMNLSTSSSSSSYDPASSRSSRSDCSSVDLISSSSSDSESDSDSMSNRTTKHPRMESSVKPKPF